MRESNTTWVSVAAIVSLVITQCATAAESQGRGPSSSSTRSPASERATGTLTVGTSQVRLSHAYAFAEMGNDPAHGNYRIFVTDRSLAAAALQDEDGRAAMLVDGKVRGIQVVVAPDNRVLRAIVHHPELDRLGMALGLAILEPTEFQSTTRDGRRIAGTLRTARPVQDARVGKPIQYEVTFSAALHPQR